MPRLVAPRNTKKLSEQQKQDRALAEVKKDLGVKTCDKLSRQWDKLLQCKTHENKKKADGMIICLLLQNVSQRKIKALFTKLGTSRIIRLRGFMKNPIEAVRPAPSHAATGEEKIAIKSFIESYATEDGYPCSHRRPRTYFVEAGLTW